MRRLRDAFGRFSKKVEAAGDKLEATADPVIHAIETAPVGWVFDLAQLAAPKWIKLKLPGGLVLHLNDLQGRIEDIRKWTRLSPGTTFNVRDVIADTLPTEIILNETVRVALPGISSSAAEVGIEAGWNTDDIMAHLEHMMGKVRS